MKLATFSDRFSMRNTLIYNIAGLCLLPLGPKLFKMAKKVRKNVPQPVEAEDLEGTILPEGAERLKLWVIGESTMAGVGTPTNREGFAGSLAEEISAQTGRRVDWQVLAKSGYTAEDVYNNLIPELPQSEEKQLIVIGLGGNDTFELNTPSRWRKRIKRLIHDAQQKLPNSPIVFANMPPISEFPAFPPLLRSVLNGLVLLLGNELAETVKKIPNVHYMDFVIELVEWGKAHGVPEDQLFDDGVHPSAASYQIWAKKTAEFIFEQQILPKS